MKEQHFKVHLENGKVLNFVIFYSSMQELYSAIRDDIEGAIKGGFVVVSFKLKYRDFEGDMIECNSYDALKTGIMDFQGGKQMSQANDHDVFGLFVHSVILEDAPSVSVSSNNVKPFVTKSKSGIRLKFIHSDDVLLRMRIKLDDKATTVISMKIHLATVRGIPATAMTFHHKGRIMSDNETILESKLDDLDIIAVIWPEEFDEGNQLIRLRVSNAKGKEYTVPKIFMNSHLRFVKDGYARENDLPIGTLKFTYDGVPIQDSDTPSSLQMEDDDLIEVHEAQYGGRQNTHTQI